MRRALLVGGSGGALCCMDCSLIDAALPSMIGHVFSSGWQAAFFVAIAQVGMIVASAVGKPALTRLGSSGVLRTAAALSVLGTGILVLSAGCYPILLAGRCLHGIGRGLVFLAMPLYLSDSVLAEKRGRTICFYQLMITVGMIVGSAFGWCAGHLVGSAAVWRVDFLFGMTPALLLLVFVGRGSGPLVVQAPELRGAAMRTTLATVAVAIALPSLVQFVGIGVVITYSVGILRQSGFVGLDANLADVIIKGAYALMTAVAMVLIGHASSRKLLMIGSGGVALSLVSAALSFGAPAPLLLSLILFVLFFAIGPGACVWLVPAEVLPLRYRAIGMSVATFASHVSTLAVVMTFLPATKALGPRPVFSAYAIMAVVMFVLCLFFLPRRLAVSSH